MKSKLISQHQRFSIVINFKELRQPFVCRRNIKMDTNVGVTKTVRRFHKKSVELRQELGKGQFGKVYKACIRDSKLPKYVAIKIVWPFIHTGQENVDFNDFRNNAFSEMYKMSLLNHKNVVQLLGMVESDIPWFVVEYMKDGSLLESLRKKPELRDKDMIKYCYQIASGMEYLHENKVLHKDLASRNILIDGKSLKIADMGLCSFATEKIGGSYSINGKPFAFRQAARECIVEQVYTFETDVWAFGVLMYEIWSFGSVPYGKHSIESDVRILLVEGKNPLDVHAPKFPSEILALLLGHIFLVDWKLRPSFGELKKFFHGLSKGKEALVNAKQIHPTFLNSSSPAIKEQPEPESCLLSQAVDVNETRERMLQSQGHRSNHNNLPHKISTLIQDENGGSIPDSTIPKFELDESPPPPTLPSSLPKSDFLSSMRPRSGSHGPEDLHYNRKKRSNANLATTSLEQEQSSWLFSAQNKLSTSASPRRSLTPSDSLDIPFTGGIGNKSASAVSLYPEFIPGRFQKDKRVHSQELL